MEPSVFVLERIRKQVGLSPSGSEITLFLNFFFGAFYCDHGTTAGFVIRTCSLSGLKCIDKNG